MQGTTLISLFCMAVMGLAIQRGGTCFVHAVFEMLTERSARRLLAILEAALWVSGGLALAWYAGFASAITSEAKLSALTIAGGTLLGVGAVINRACALGTVAQLGSGNWAYAMTPFGYFIACLSMNWLLPPAAQPASVASLLKFEHAAWLAPVFLAYLTWRLGVPLWKAFRQDGNARYLIQQIATPHAATVVIGAGFVVLLLQGGHWTYTDLLAELATGQHAAADALGFRVLLVLVLFAGAVIGGVTAGKWQPTAPRLQTSLSCLAGGAVMALGSRLVPGSNDHLILIGLPLLQAHAWLALASMGLTIAAAIRLQMSMQRAATTASH